MSNPLAIAAVTATLRDMIAAGIAEDASLAGAQVTTQPPDAARDAADSVINVFLYQSMPSAAWRNLPYPDQGAHVGNRLFAPLALDLYYLITVFNRDNNDLISQRMLGYAMRILHEYPMLNRDMIQSSLPDNDLYRQIERVRITHHPATVDELSKIWSSLQSEYRMSVVYQVSVILIELSETEPSALPVLARSDGDRGANVEASMMPHLPALYELLPPRGHPAINIGDTLIARWLLLPDTPVRLRFENARYGTLFELDGVVDAAEATTDPRAGVISQVNVEFDPALVGDQPAGVYTVSGSYTDELGEQRMTNALPLVFAPQMVNPTTDPIVGVDIGAGVIEIAVTTTPAVLTEQNVSLIVNSLELVAQERPDAHTLIFRSSALASGIYPARLRIDGIDSLVVEDYTVRPPNFDPSQRIQIP